MLGLGMLAGSACFGAPSAHSPWAGWKSLRLQVRSASLFSGRLEMQLVERSGQRCLETRATARLFGASIARSRTSSVLDRATGRTLEHLSVSRKRGRRYVFGEHGYTVEKFTSPQGPDGPRDRWETTSTKEYPYPPAAGDGTTPLLFDYYGMILRLRKEKLSRPNDETTLYVATPKGPQAYTISVGELRTAERTIKDLATGKSRTLKLREMRLRIRPTSEQSEDEGFLNMEGETELWVEAESKTPVEISGRVPRVGRVLLQLVEMG